MKYRLWYSVFVQHQKLWSFYDCEDWNEINQKKEQILENQKGSVYTPQFCVTPAPLPSNDYLFYGFLDQETLENDQETVDYFKSKGQEWKPIPYYGTYYIVHKDFWEQEGCLDDSTISNEIEDLLPNGFNEIQESHFEYGGPLAEGIEKLKNAGFTWCEAIGAKFV